MKGLGTLPRILIIDDLFGRTVDGRSNEDRENLCGRFLLEDVTGDRATQESRLHIRSPIAQAVFHRGQTPAHSCIGDVVENDLLGTLRFVETGWKEWKPDRPRWSILLLDLCFYTGAVTVESDNLTPGMPAGRSGDDDPHQYFGLALLKAIHERFPDLPIVILSSQSRQDVSLEFTLLGALGFLPRSDPDSPRLLRDYIWRHGLIVDDSGAIIGHSKPLLEALRAARRMSSDRRNVLIRGSRGTGKELLAKYIHRVSNRDKERPYMVLNSGSLSPNLYASELFGHRRGSFTGAIEDRLGCIARANGGDLVLDEIGRLPQDIQSGLLRVIEYKVVSRLGSEDFQQIDVRFISATNDDIEALTFDGSFRADLLDRLREGGTISLPPLIQRSEDIHDLVTYFLREAIEQRPDIMVRDVVPAVFQKIYSYEWPGSIRELRNCIINAVNNHPDVEHLVPEHLAFSDLTSAPREPNSGLEIGSQALQISNSVSPSPNRSPLDSLVDTLNTFASVDLDPIILNASLPKLQESVSFAIAHLLRLALQVTMRRTPDNPDGELLIHPAVKLLTGDKSVTASKAADIIKKLIGQLGKAKEDLLADPILRKAYDTASRLRPVRSTQRLSKSAARNARKIQE